MKNHPQIFIQGTSVPNFSQIEPFLKPPDCPKVLGQKDRQTDRQIHRQTLSDSSSTEVEKRLVHLNPERFHYVYVQWTLKFQGLFLTYFPGYFKHNDHDKLGSRTTQCRSRGRRNRSLIHAPAHFIPYMFDFYDSPHCWMYRYKPIPYQKTGQSSKPSLKPFWSR